MSKTFADYYKLNTLVDVIRVPKVHTSGEQLPIDTNFVSIPLLVFELFLRTFFVHTVELKPIIKAQIPGKLVSSGIMMYDSFSKLRENLDYKVDYDNYYYYE